MESLQSTAATAVVLAIFGVVGWGFTALLGPKLESDVRAALAPVIGAAAFFALAAVLLPAAPFVAVLGSVAALAATCAWAIRGPLHAPRLDGRWGPVAVVSFVAAAVALVPTFAHGNGTPSTYGNIDPYLWVSQARALLHGPIDGPSSIFPDRAAYEHLVVGHWAPGIPALVAMLAWLLRTDPVEAFGAASALCYVLTPLMTYVVARAALGWSRRLGTAAGVVSALGGYAVFASYFGWEPQLIGTAFGLGIALMLWLGLRASNQSFSFAILGALFVSGALGAYRQPFFPYILLLVVSVTFSARFVRRACVAGGGFRRTAITFGVGAFTLAMPSLIGIARGANRFWSRQSDVVDWKHIARGLPSEALGLSPRLSDLSNVPSGLRIAGLVLGIPVLLHGMRSLLVAREPGSALVLMLAGMTVAGNAVLQATVLSPYLSLKIVAYGGPALVFVALAPLRGRRLPTPALTAAVPFALLTTAAILASGVRTTNADPLDRVVVLANQLPARSPISIDIRSPWDQMWIIYYLRNRPLQVLHPTTFLTELGFQRPSTYYHQVVARYELVEEPGHRTIECWHLPGRVLSMSRARADDENARSLNGAGRLSCGFLRR